MDDEHLKQRKATGTDGDGAGKSDDNVNNTTKPSDAEAAMSSSQSKDAYFEALRLWLQQVQMQQMALASFPYYLANFQQQMGTSGTGPGTAGAVGPQQYQPNPFYYPMFPQPTLNAGPPINPNIGMFGGFGQQQQPNPMNNNLFNQNRNNLIDNVRRNEEVIQQNGGYEYVIAPIWKRFAAETIDVLILFVIKIMAAFLIIDIFDFDFGFDLDFDSLKTSLEEDYTDFLTFSSDLLLVEIITKVLVCFYEAVWTAQGQTFIGGATPGKIIMGLRILYVEGVVPLDQFPPGLNLNNALRMRALLFPAANPGFKRALLRAIAKNMLMTLMFPMCFVLLFFRHNRTGYDVMTKTIVVEENAAPVHRRL